MKKSFSPDYAIHPIETIIEAMLYHIDWFRMTKILSLTKKTKDIIHNMLMENYKQHKVTTQGTEKFYMEMQNTFNLEGKTLMNMQKHYNEFYGIDKKKKD